MGWSATAHSGGRIHALRVENEHPSYIPIYCAHSCLQDKWNANWQPHQHLIGRSYAMLVDGKWTCARCKKEVYFGYRQRENLGS